MLKSPKLSSAQCDMSTSCASNEDCEGACGEYSNLENGRCVNNCCSCNTACNCLNGGTCLPNSTEVYGVCACPPQWSGPSCEIPCPCKNGGTCSGPNGACVCPPGWFGALCDQPCACKNGGTCVGSDGTCDCKPPWFGSLCEQTLTCKCADGTTCTGGAGSCCTDGMPPLVCDPARADCSVPCINGTCNGTTCTCLKNWIGVDCSQNVG